MNDQDKYVKLAILFYIYLRFEKGLEYDYNSFDFNKYREGIKTIYENDDFFKDIFSHVGDNIPLSDGISYIDLINKIKITNKEAAKAEFNKIINTNKNNLKEFGNNFITKVIITLAKELKPEVSTIYDPTMGLGQFLKAATNYYDLTSITGEEIDEKTFNTAKMNLYINGINKDILKLHHSDSVYSESIKEEFDLVLSEPPYKVTSKLDEMILETISFNNYIDQSIRTISDYKFIIKGLINVKDDGLFITTTIAHLLFKENSKKIRKKLTKVDNVLDAIIRLPKGAHSSVRIPIYILVFNKSRKDNSPIKFIDLLSRTINKINKEEKEQDVINDILKLIKKKSEVKGALRLVGIDEIEENDYNLNFSRYFKDHTRLDKINLDKELNVIETSKEEINKIDQEIENLIKELV